MNIIRKGEFVIFLIRHLENRIKSASCCFFVVVVGLLFGSQSRLHSTLKYSVSHQPAALLKYQGHDLLEDASNGGKT